MPRGLVAAATVFIIARRPLIVNTFFKLFLFFLLFPRFARCAAFYFLNFMARNTHFRLDFAQTAPKMIKIFPAFAFSAPKIFPLSACTGPIGPAGQKAFAKMKPSVFFEAAKLEIRINVIFFLTQRLLGGILNKS